MPTVKTRRETKDGIVESVTEWVEAKASKLQPCKDVRLCGKTNLKPSASHFDAGKAPLDQLPFHSLMAVAKVMDFGAKKYGRYNWRAGQEWTRYAASGLRHLYAWISGEDNDPESGISHLAHGVCNLLFLLEWQRTGKGEDDRYKEA